MLDHHHVADAPAQDDPRGVALRVHRVDRDDRGGKPGEHLQQVPHRGDLVRLLLHGDLPQDRADAVRQRRDQVRGFPGPVIRAADGLAVDGDHHPAAGLHGPGVQPGAEDPVQNVGTDQGERGPERGLLRRPAGRAQYGKDLRAASAAHCPIAANDLEPAITAAIPTASNPASGCQRPRFFRGSGTWARRWSRYWLRAAGIGEDVIGGRASLAAGDGERENFHRSARALPAARGHAGRIIRRYGTAGHSLNSRLCRVPGSRGEQILVD
jgi:hypothetical protein